MNFNENEVTIIATLNILDVINAFKSTYNAII